MHRLYTRKEYAKKITFLRKIVPHISITSDILVGFPGESEEDFNQTRTMLEEICFDDVFIFHYSDRPGTHASKLPDKVPYKIKISRLFL